MLVQTQSVGHVSIRVRMMFWMRMVAAVGLLSAAIPAGPACAGEKSTVIVIGGTGSALGGMKEIAKAFRKEHPEITVSFVPSLGSSGGIKAALSGSLDLALSARTLTDSEREQGASAVEYARTPFLFTTKDASHAAPLTLRKVASIYGGDAPQWPDGAPLRLVLRPEKDMDTLLLRSMSPEMDIAVQKAVRRQGLLVAVTDQENADALVKVKGAFGATTLAQILAEQRPLVPLSLDGVAPGVDALAEGRYPFSKVFYAISTPRSSSATRQFIEYLVSPKARAILTRTGHLVSARSGTADRRE
jgi:phosphate transport system substrate-binding protein